MRRVFTTAEAIDGGITMSELRWGERTGRWRRLERGVYVEGADEPTRFDRAIGAVVVTKGIACGHLAGVLHRLDSVAFDRGRPYLTLPPGNGCRRGGVRGWFRPARGVVIRAIGSALRLLVQEQTSRSSSCRLSGTGLSGTGLSGTVAAGRSRRDGQLG